MSLDARLAVPVEILGAEDLRAFRLSARVGAEALRLARPAPFEIGRPVTVRFTLPGAPAPFALRATVALDGARDGEGADGGRKLVLGALPAAARAAIAAYVAERLGLPAVV